MKPSDRSLPWQRLVAAARRAPDERATSAPYGFATRVAALAASAPRPTLAFAFERLALRALGVACLLMLVSVAANYSALAGTAEEEADLQDPITAVLDIGS